MIRDAGFKPIQRNTLYVLELTEGTRGSLPVRSGSFTLKSDILNIGNSAMETSRVGKRGTLVIPVKLRQRFNVKEGDLFFAEEHEDGILLRPAVAVPVEIYTPERKAEFFLNNAVTKEDYDAACEDIRAMGLDPAKIPHTEDVSRDALPSNVEMDKRWEAIRKKLSKRALISKRHA
jgi:AbrB family looped-hinge helix DNA binding protein